MSAQAGQLTHGVFFSLKDNSPENCQSLINDCHTLLVKPDGIESLHAGTRTPDLNRDVNDDQHDVALVVIFENRAAHDAYQTHPAHVDFIQRNKENWASVRIFDADAH